MLLEKEEKVADCRYTTFFSGQQEKFNEKQFSFSTKEVYIYNKCFPYSHSIDCECPI